MEKGCLDDPRRYLIVPFAFIQILKGENDAIILYAYLRNTFNMLNAANKLQSDNSFYLSAKKIMEALNLTRRKYERARKILIQYKLINIVVKPINFCRIQFFYFDYDLYNLIIKNENYTLRIDEITSDVVVSKNATTESSDGYSLELTEQEELPIVKESANEYKEKIMNAWNLVADKHGLSKIIMIKDDRLKKFKSVISYLGMTEKEFFNAIHIALSESKFLRGVGKKWKASFDFFLSKQKALKAIEGGYKDNPNEFLERLSDVETMTYSEAREARKDIALKQWEEKYRKLEKEQKLIGDNENDKN